MYGGEHPFKSAVVTVVVAFVVGIQCSHAQFTWHTSSDAVWAHSCDFSRHDIGSVAISASRCSGACGARSSCTHFAWSRYNGGTCWLKSKRPISTAEAVRGAQPGMICGILRKALTPGGGGGPPAPLSWRTFGRSGKLSEYSRWFSEERGGYSGRMAGPIAGMVCSGRYCDNLRLFSIREDSSAAVVQNSAHWTRWFTDGNPSWADCPPDMVVNEVQCKGRYCDDMRLQCGRLASRFRVRSGSVRTVGFFSDENGEQRCPDGYYLWGMACRGRYCDDIKINCVLVQYRPLPSNSNWRTLTRTSGTIVRSRWFSEEDGHGYSFRMFAPVAGIVCRGRYCDEKQLVTVQRADGLAVRNSAHWTNWFTDGNPSSATCPSDMVVNEIQCRGRYCDDMRLQCGRMASNYRIVSGDKRVASWFSEEEGERLCPDGYYVSGVACRGSFCDGIQLTCVRVDYDIRTAGTLQPFPSLPDSAIAGQAWSHDPPNAFIYWAARRWMLRIPGSTRIHRISIPGTHDSGAHDKNKYCETQSWTIRQQLHAGIRFLDIRCRRVGSVFAIHHGQCFLDKMFGDVMNDVIAFLRANPSETVLMRVKDEHDPAKGSRSFGHIWNAYMARYGGWFVRNVNGQLPMLHQLRGKVLVLRNNNEISRSYGIAFDHSNTDVQDFYKIRTVATSGDTISTASKRFYIQEYLERAKTSNSLVMNHVSAVGTGASFLFNQYPRRVAKGLNNFTFRAIGRYIRKKNTGVVILDYPAEKLVYRVLRTNF